MEIKIDQLFRDTFDYYYKSNGSASILNKVNDTFSHYNASLICDSVNIIKTATVLELTYTEAHNKIVDKVIKEFPVNDDIELFILNVALKVMISMGYCGLLDFMSKPRDIYKEVAAKYFRTQSVRVSDDMLREVVDATNKFTKNSYSIESPPVSSWDEYFYNVCAEVARNSKCYSRRIGALLVVDKSIVSTGYNGPPRGVLKCDLRWYVDEAFKNKYYTHFSGTEKDLEGVCPRKAIGSNTGENLGMCVAGHAERNALINAAREGIKTKGGSLYMSCGIPCTPCLVEIINAGIKEIVVTSLNTYDESSMYLLQQSDLEIRLFDFIRISK